MRTAVLLLAVALSSAALRLLGPSAVAAVRPPAPVRLEDAVTRAAVVVAAVLAAWYLVTAVGALLAGALRAAARVRDAGAPAGSRRGRTVAAGAAWLERAVRRCGAPLLRRGLALGVGLGVALGSGPALAAPAAPEEVPLDLRPGATAAGMAPGGHEAPAPAEPTVTPAAPTEQPRTVAPPGGGPRPGAAAPPPGAEETARAPQSADEPERHTVAPGESLWQIAADRLGPGAPQEAVAREWPRWYAANAAVIGPDPNLIHPGQELLAPPKEVGP